MTRNREWAAIAQSVRGASHVRAGSDNQDAVEVHVAAGGGLPAILAVSDGHGSSKCFRSHVGSRIAVEVAVAILQEFAEAVTRDHMPPAEIRRQSEQRLPQKMFAQWREKVQQHYGAHPFQEEELKTLDEVALRTIREAKEQKSPFVAYGATLVTTLFGEAQWDAADRPSGYREELSTDPPQTKGNYLLCLQLGDGEILVVTGKTNKVEQPMEVDENLIANETTSLCQDDAWKKFRFRFHFLLEDSAPALILLATDGYPNSFETPTGFVQVASDLLNLLDRDGVEKVAADMPGWLEDASQGGSGDDVSVAILYSKSLDPRNATAASPAGADNTPANADESISRADNAIRRVDTTAGPDWTVQMWAAIVSGLVLARRWFRRHPSVGMASAAIAVVLGIYTIITALPSRPFVNPADPDSRAAQMATPKQHPSPAVPRRKR